MTWVQRSHQLPAFQRGFHLITDHLLRACPEIQKTRMGLLHVFLQHTSASLSINENADPDVRTDMETAISVIVPENLDYLHTMEGSDDMPAHVKSSLLGCSLSIPVHQGRLALGVWQGIYLCEHRNHASGRNLFLTLMAENNSNDAV